MVHENREHGAADISALIAFGRNPLRLANGGASSAGTATNDSPSFLSRLLGRLRAAFLRAGTPTSVPERTSAETASTDAKMRAAGSLLRRMD